MDLAALLGRWWRQRRDMAPAVITPATVAVAMDMAAVAMDIAAVALDTMVMESSSVGSLGSMESLESMECSEENSRSGSDLLSHLSWRPAPPVL